MKSISITRTSKSHPNISYIYPMGLISMFLDCTLTVISFLSPYWITSISESEFTNIGLWNVCYSHFKYVDLPFKIYFENCYFLYSEDIKMFRDWLLPSWLVLVQILVIISSTLSLICLSAIIFSLFNQKGKKFYFIYTLTIVLAIKKLVIITSLLIFGTKSYFHDWSMNSLDNTDIKIGWSFWCHCFSLSLSFATSGFLLQEARSILIDEAKSYIISF